MASGDPDIYDSFDLHYLASEAVWECVQYYDPNNDPGYFNVVNPDVEVVYGYNF